MEDQLHFLFHCSLFNTQREELYRKARERINGWDKLSEYAKLSQLFNNMTQTLAKYVKNIFMLRRNTIFK